MNLSVEAGKRRLPEAWQRILCSLFCVSLLYKSASQSSSCSLVTAALHDRALLVALFRLAGFLALLDFGDHAFEGFADVLVVARAGLGEAAAQLLGELLAVCESDLALFGAQVGLVADDRERDGVGTLEERSVSEKPVRRQDSLASAMLRAAEQVGRLNLQGGSESCL